MFAGLRRLPEQQAAAQGQALRATPGTLHQAGMPLSCAGPRGLAINMLALAELTTSAHDRAGIVWDEEGVYRYFTGPPNNWDRSKTFFNIIRKLDIGAANGSNYDPLSVMHYDFPAGCIFEPAKYRNGIRRAGGLSQSDIEWIKKFYPSLRGGLPNLAAGNTKSVQPSFAGAQWDFEVEVATSGEYKFETAGESDTVLLLQRKDENGTMVKIAADDDSGEDRNAALTVALEPGVYTLRMRVYWVAPGKQVTVVWGPAKGKK
jgi:hypothetical protein